MAVWSKKERGEGLIASIHKRAFSLPEVLIALGALSVLVGVLMPQLTRARRTAIQSVTASNLRTHGLVFSMYNGDYRDTWPCYVKPGLGERYLEVPSSELVIETRYMWASALWNFALADLYYDGNPAHASFYPYDYPYGYHAPELRGGSTPYVYSCSFWADPLFWDARTRTGPEQWRATKSGEVAFPAMKILIVSDFVSPRSLDADIRPPSPPPSDAMYGYVLCDGAVRFSTLDRVHSGVTSGDGVWTAPVHQGMGEPGRHTVLGVRGQDVR
ncbi:MAG: type II secretion system protein [Phycisphaerales bacterium]